ncbi:MAG: hypothetical protein RLZZ37_57 [Actinomycetota bacterium]
MKKIFFTILVASGVVIFVAYSLFVFRTERFISSNSIVFKSDIRPVFNPKIEYYFSSDCNVNKVQIEIDKNLNHELNTKGPITKLSIKYLNLLTKNYFITCIEPRVSPVELTNAEGVRKEFVLMDELVLPNEVNSQYSGTITLRDSLGTPIWWLSPNSTPIANLKLNFLRDPKLIDNGTKVLFVGSTSPALGTSLDGFYMVYDLKTHKIIQTYTGDKVVNGKGTLDFHDLQILPNGEAVGIRYAKRSGVDLTSIGISEGTEILDSEIVILNSDGTEKRKISIMDLIKPEEISVNQSAYYNPTIPPVDVIHTNSVEVVGDFVYISSRHLDSVHKINWKDGSIVWRLGGISKTDKDLKVKNLYGALNQFNNTISLNNLFSGQHDARILKNGELSVFDNGTTGNRNPRVLVFKIDEKKMEAEITKVVTGSSQSTSYCCGSARELEDGSWLINWGGKFDQSRATLANGVSSTVLPTGVATRIMVRPANVFAYRVIPYYLNNEQLDLFRQDLINRNN